MNAHKLVRHREMHCNYKTMTECAIKYMTVLNLILYRPINYDMIVNSQVEKNVRGCVAFTDNYKRLEFIT